MTVQTGETTGTALQQAAQARLIQAALTNSLTRDVTQLWPTLDPKSLDRTYPTWLQRMSALINRYRGMSGLAAGIYYGDTREAITGLTTPVDLIQHAGPADPDWLSSGLGYSGPGLLNNPAAQPGSALSITQGTATRMVADAGRTTVIDTVHADPEAVGWYRLTDGQPCAFCALLASRGIAYKSQKSADFKAHNDCGCVAAPAFSRGQTLPQISQTADSIYTDQVSHLPNSQRLAAFRKAWAEHLAS